MFGSADSVTVPELMTEIQMTRQVFGGTIILTEGKTDLKRFQSFFQRETFEIVVCWNRQNAIRVAEQMKDNGEERFFALIDADFDRLEMREITDEHIIYSDGHDFDSDIYNSNALEEYIFQITGDVTGSYLAEIREKVARHVENLSNLRYLNQRDNWSLPLSEVDLNRALDDLRVNIAKVASRAHSKAADPKIDPRRAVESAINFNRIELLDDQYDNGHDLCFVLGLELRGPPYERNKANCHRSEVEMHLRMCLKVENLQEKTFWSRISELSRSKNLGIV